MRYTVQPQQLEAAARWMSDLAAAWDARLNTINHLAETD
jgi:hypothetical protein